tara:strand:+ start:202 stop:1092 length:891 start_codon:yes stop_codon:yes gene_type:complete
MIHKLLAPRFRSKILFLDYDWTLVQPKSNHTFPSNVDDWKWLRPNIPSIIKEYYKKGFGITVVTNQSKSWKVEQILQVLKTLDTPITILIATNKNDYKPSLNITNEAMKIEKINKEKSIMCGDALGRETDYSDTDKLFAEKLGIKYMSPEELFPLEQVSHNIKQKNIQEVIVMVGMPGSGKSTLAKEIFTDYNIIQGDIYKTSKNMLKYANKIIEDKKGIVFDATNPSKDKRKEYIDFSKEHNLPIRCIYMNTSLSDSLARNSKREKPVPRIVYNIYNKKLEIPMVEEGFDEVLTL